MYQAAIEYLRRQSSEVAEIKQGYEHQVSQLNIEMKIRDDMIHRLETDIQSLKEINSSSVYQQYVSLAE